MTLELEQDVRREVESRPHEVDVETDWYTPAGKRRSAPIYVAYVANDYLGKEREVKGKSPSEIKLKVNECIAKWNEQEIRKRVAAGKKDAKEQAQAETARLDQEAKSTLTEMAEILKATLSVDDRINWDAERDTREHPPFSFRPPPAQPQPTELALPAKPALTWLLPGRKRRWEAACEEARRLHVQGEEASLARWRGSVAEHNAAMARAERQHQEDGEKFAAERDRFNLAISEFRRRYEAGDREAIREYCSRVLERSQYPEPLTISHSVEFDAESNYVVIDLELPPGDAVPAIGGYRFVSGDNRSAPIPLKKKEAAELHDSILDQIVVRTMHEIFEGCYVGTVTGAVINGWITSLNKATGKDERRQVRCVASDRATFESFDLSRVGIRSTSRVLPRPSVGAYSDRAWKASISRKA